MAQTLLISIRRVKQYTIVDTNIDDKTLKIAIIDAQEQMLEPKIGTVLYDKLQTMVQTKQIPSDYQFLLIYKIWPYLINCIVYKVVLSLQYRLTNTAVVKDTNQNSTAIDIAELRSIRQERENAIHYHEGKLTSYLIQNSTTFPEYSQIDVTGVIPELRTQPRSFYVDPENFVTVPYKNN